MDSTIIVQREDGSSDCWHSRDVGLDELLRRERRSPLGEAYLLWSDFVHPSMASDFPSASGAPQTVGGPDADDAARFALADAFRLDCERRNPFDFRIVVPGPPERSVRIGDIAPDHLRHVLARDMSYAKGSRLPVYQHISLRIGGVARECMRLLLPALGAGGQVAQIYGFCRPILPSGAAPAICPALPSRRMIGDIPSPPPGETPPCPSLTKSTTKSAF